MSEPDRFIPRNDQPAAICQLGREVLTKEIARAAAEATPPLVLGVHGDWGSGKTSFMRHVQNFLEESDYEPGLVTVWFEAWRYQNEPAPVVALLQEMRRSFANDVKRRSQAAKLGEVVFRSVLGGMDQAVKLVGLESSPLSLEKIQALGEQWEKDRLAVQLVPDSITGFLRDAIANLLPVPDEPLPGPATPRVVVFIDDLDRCNSLMAYRLLEGLKIYLNLDNCVFILAMNQQVITDAIAESMQKDDHLPVVKLRAEAYLEKLCANIWRLPPPPVPHEFFLLHVDGDTDSPSKQAIKRAADSGRHGFLPPNPRRLKALANLYNRLWRRTPFLPAPVAEPEILALRVLVVAYVYQFHSELYQRWRHDPFFFEALREWMTQGRALDDAGTGFFSGLILPTRAAADPALETPSFSIHGNYPDPAAPGVFWIAPLLQGPLAADKPDDYRELLRLEHPR